MCWLSTCAHCDDHDKAEKEADDILEEGLAGGWDGVRGGGQKRCQLLPGEIADGQNVENLPPAANVGGGSEEGDDEDHGVEQVLALLHVALCGAGVVVVEVQELGRAES